MNTKFKTDKAYDYVEKYVKEYFGDIPLYSNEEIIKLYNEYKNLNDPSVKDKLVEANLRKVIRCAYNIHNKYKETDISELVSIGLERLVHVIDEYNDSISTSFLQYINSSITTYIERSPKIAGNTFDLSSQSTKEMNTIKRFVQEFKKNNGYKPTPEYISQKTGIKAYKVKDLLSIMDEPQSMQNYNQLVTDDMQKVDNASLLEEFFKIVDSTLDEREKFVIRLRFGLEGNNTFDLDSIAQQLNVSKERVRQIENQSLRKLKIRLDTIENKNLRNDLLGFVYGDGNLPFDGTLDTEGYTSYQKDYEGFGEEEYEEKGFGLR